MCGFRDQGVEIGRFRGGDCGGFRDQGWRSEGLEVEMCGFRDQRVEIGRFKGGDR